MFQLKTTAGTHVQRQTQFDEFDLSFTKHSITSDKNNARARVNCQTLFFEFDLSLTKIQFSTKNPFRNTCTKSNYFFEFDLSLATTQNSTKNWIQTRIPRKRTVLEQNRDRARDTGRARGRGQRSSTNETYPNETYANEAYPNETEHSQRLRQELQQRKKRTKQKLT